MNLYAQLAFLINFIYQPAHFFEAVFNLRSILDILIIALFFYFAIAILQKTKSISVIIGISILAITYGASVFLNLPLTRTIFQYFLNFFLIVVAVVFQNELRRFFSLIGVLGGRYKKIQPLDQMFEAIIYSVKKLASSKIGALIVFPGKEIDFNNLDAEELKASINLFEVKPEKQKLFITENDIKHPLHISVVKIEPESISLNFVQRSE